MSPQGVTDAVMAFMDAVSADFRHDGDIYTGVWFWNPGTLNNGPASRYALWVSNYTSSPNIHIRGRRQRCGSTRTRKQLPAFRWSY